MRQRGQLDRHPDRAQLVLDVGTPSPGTDQAFPKAVAESLLVADVARRIDQCRAAHVGGPQRKDPRFFAAQLVALAGGQFREDGLDGLAAPDHPALSLAPVQAVRKIDAFIDDVEVAGVVQYPLVGGIARKYADPEIDVGLQFGRLRERLGGRGQAESEQQHQAADLTFSLHSDLFRFQP